jgi:hypothetical protein
MSVYTLQQIAIWCGAIVMVAGTAGVVLWTGRLTVEIYAIVHERVASNRRRAGKPLPLLPFPWLFAPRWRVAALIRQIEAQKRIISDWRERAP